MDVHLVSNSAFYISFVFGSFKISTTFMLAIWVKLYQKCNLFCKRINVLHYQNMLS